MSAADVIGILGFALQMAGKLCDALQIIIDAPEDLEGLQVEVVCVKELLAQIVETPDDANSRANKSLDVLRLRRNLIERARKLIGDASQVIEKVTKLKGDGTRKVKRAMWLLHTVDVKDLAEDFKDLYLAISTVYAVDASLRTRFIESNVPSLEQIKDAIIPSMERLLDEDRIAQIMIRSLTIVSRQQRGGRQQFLDESNPLRGNGEITHRLPVPPLSLTDSNEVLTHASSYGEPDPSTTTTHIGTSTISTSVDSHSIVAASLPGPVLTPYSVCNYLRPRCPLDCKCRCHKRPKEHHLVPSMLRSWLGDIRIPEGFITSLIPFNLSCNDDKCVQTVKNLSIFKWYFPTVFARVEAGMESQSFRLNFVIQTPRIVESLDFLDELTFEELKMKLSTRELTVNDVDSEGLTVLHNIAYMIVHDQHSDGHEMMHYLIDSGAPHDWEYNGQTVAGYVASNATYWHGDTLAASMHVRSFEYSVAKPLFQEDMEDAWERIRTKLHWSDLLYLLANPPSSPVQLEMRLSMILARADAASHLNASDRYGRAPLYQAIHSCPQTVDALLRAGANPHLVLAPLSDAVTAFSWHAIGPLVRAGANVNERYSWSNGDTQTALHDVIRIQSARGPGTRLPCALELVRHAGHLLDWDVEDEYGRTSLWWADWGMKQHPDDKDLAFICELYKTRQLSLTAHLIDRSRLGEEAVAAIHLQSTSLIKVGLAGNVQAIGELIDAGAMVNERDASGRTLLHLVAMGVVPKGHAVALELVRHGGYGVDWDALTVDRESAEQLAKETLECLPAIEDEQREEVSRILRLLQFRALPEGMDYIYPCMHADYCKACSARPCSEYCSIGLRVPGAFC